MNKQKYPDQGDSASEQTGNLIDYFERLRRRQKRRKRVHRTLGGHDSYRQFRKSRRGRWRRKKYV